MLYLEFQVLPDWRLLVTTVYPGSACCKVIKDMRAESNSHLIMEPSFDVEQYINCIASNPDPLPYERERRAWYPLSAHAPDFRPFIPSSKG